MLAALIVFLVMYVLMLSLQKYRTWIALTGAVIFVVLGSFGVFEYSFMSAISEVDYNVLLMIAGTMGTVTLFIESKMPARLAEVLTVKVPNVKWAVAILSLFAGVISAFVDNVATVLMVAPVGLAISKKLKFSPVLMLISIAVSSNLQGAATLVGDTTSILLGGVANMNFLEFFWMNGRPGIFWGVELGALASIFVLLFIFRKETQKIEAAVETEVEDYFPSWLMIGTVVLLIIASFVPEPQTEGFLHEIYALRNGIICVALCLIGVIRSFIKTKSSVLAKKVVKDFDYDTILMLLGLFIVIGGLGAAGVIDAIADVFKMVAGESPLRLYVILVVASVVLSAFVDNIPYVMTMLPVVAGIATKMNGGAGVDPNVFYFGLLIGATLGGNLTPIGASANVAATGILRKNGEEVKTSEFLKIGIPFTLSAVIVGAVYIWIVWGV